jgi:hypothetical protein
MVEDITDLKIFDERNVDAAVIEDIYNFVKKIR